ncbi:MAG TPA: serine/threonine-protein kinase, partial [Roseiflexaceae bacterium]|nr:serine/threonine-protein kinase [Roseiflexaceae bacterium]
MFQRLFNKGGKHSGRAVQLGREFNVGDVIEQRFEVEQVRRGFMGIVYIAHDRQRRGRVVLKTFQNKFLWDEDAIARFSAEAELWVRLGSHPNIVRAYDLRTFLGKPHVVAEYVHGGPLRTLVGHLQLKEAIDYAIQICWGMGYAVEHAAILHRDIKPDNIMVTLDGQAKVTDFGLARVLPRWQWSEQQQDRLSTAARIRAPAAEVLGGTLPYMAPEAIEGSTQVGVWTDVYAFGVMLYELFTGKLPFDSMRDESLIRMHFNVPARDPRELKPALHKGAAHIVLRCLAKRQGERYQSFGELSDDLQLLRKHLFSERYQVIWPASGDAERDRWAERGLAHMDMGEYSEALTCFGQALGLDDSHAESWLHLARARLKLWQYNETLNAVDEGLKRASDRNDFGQLLGVRGETYVAMMMPDKAMQAYDQGLSYTPNAPRLWREKGLLLHNQGQLREAQQCLEKALSFDKFDSLGWRLLGDVQLDQERLKKAYQAYAEALKLDPRSSIAWAR